MTDHTETRCRECDGYNCDNGCAYPPKDTEMQIPDDVLAAAEDIALEIGVTDGGLLDVTLVIARAILAERERASRIAEGRYSGPREIARVIRGIDPVRK